MLKAAGRWVAAHEQDRHHTPDGASPEPFESSTMTMLEKIKEYFRDQGGAPLLSKHNYTRACGPKNLFMKTAPSTCRSVACAMLRLPLG